MLDYEMNAREMEMAGRNRLTRYQLHVLLKAHNVPHDPGEVREVMAEMLSRRGIPEHWPPPMAQPVAQVVAQPAAKKRGRPPKKRHVENAA